MYVILLCINYYFKERYSLVKVFGFCVMGGYIFVGESMYRCLIL